MREDSLRKLLGQVKSGRLSPEKAVERLRHLPFEDLGFARVDHHRALRQGFPEVILCEGKETGEVVKIAKAIAAKGGTVFATRASEGVVRALKKAFPKKKLRHNRKGRAVLIGEPLRHKRKPGKVTIVAAGTSDIPVAEEARATIEAMGAPVKALYDVGVAGIHRLLESRKMLEGAAVVVAVAGMEGALASVVGGLVDCPVIAVPTSIGYGASFGGLAALLAMLNSCAAGVTVVNIDNGFGAGYAAAKIAIGR